MHLKGAGKIGQQILQHPNAKETSFLSFETIMTLKQAYPPEYQRVQYAFKDSMIH